MRVSSIYAIRNLQSDFSKRQELDSAIKVIEDTLENYFTSAKENLVSGESKCVLNWEDVKKAMGVFKAFGMEEIPDEITDEAAKVFVLQFGKEMLF